MSEEENGSLHFHLLILVIEQQKLSLSLLLLPFSPNPSVQTMSHEANWESTKAAEVVGVTERTGRGGLPVYEFEYVVDSTRGGMKRVFSAAFVSEKKLYILNITHSDKPESPLDNHTRMMLEQVLHSFDAAPLTRNST